MRISLSFFLAICFVAISTAQPPTLLPSHFLSGERITLKIATVTGDTIIGYCDSGGGFTAVFPNAIDRLHLQSSVKTLSMGTQSVGYISFDALVQDKSIPPMIVTSTSPVKEPIFLMPDTATLRREGQIPEDAFLGQFFFLGKSWTFDYPRRQVWVHTPLTRNAQTTVMEQVGFRKSASGEKIFGHPSMKMIVEGDTLDVLFDSGAMFTLSANAQSALHRSEQTIGGSFIARSVFDKWHAQHPDWTITPQADAGADIIEVPRVVIGNNVTVGPVLFSVRPDEVWSRGMVRSMDKVVKGALGGSAFKYLKVTIDYNSELVAFSKK